MKAVAKVAMIAAGPASASVFGAATAYALGDAPWCAVINLGMDVHRDCRYRTVEECVPNIERGSCCPNPYAGSSATVSVPGKRHAKRHSNVESR
jgi:hypothetical protein